MQKSKHATKRTLHDDLISACERMMVGITKQSTATCDWYEGIEHDGAEKAAEVLIKAADKRRGRGVTPNGYDQRWVDAINEVFKGRAVDCEIHDINDELWDRYIGPMCDAIEEGQIEGL